MRSGITRVGWSVRTAVAAVAAAFWILLLAVLAGGDGAAAVAGILNAAAVWIGANPWLAAAAFVASTAAARMAPLPAGAMMAVTGGYLFGTLAGAVLAATGAATAAALVHLVGRPLLAGVVRRRLGEQFAAVEREVARGAFNYLLALRLLPVIPGWLVNLLPLAFPIRVRTIVLATFLGLLPISMMFAGLGAGLAVIGATPEPASAGALLRWEMVLPLGALAVLALLPVALRHLSPGSVGRLLRLSRASES
jgi:uncharacterized membrane protein YdjX (TVP38/TMEM64 family)